MSSKNNLAKLKREMKLGTKWLAFHHGSGSMAAKDMGEREICKVQSNAVGFAKPDGGCSWLYFPPARCVSGHSNTFIIACESSGKPLLTYRKVD